jgi:hypothetical protein
MKEIKATQDVYVLCHNNDDIIHFIFLKEGNNLSTGQPFVEEFYSLEPLKTRLEEITKNNSELYNTVMGQVMGQTLHSPASNSVIDNGGRLSKRVSGIS